jgi:hypothetical protein
MWITKQILLIKKINYITIRVVSRAFNDVFD